MVGKPRVGSLSHGIIKHIFREEDKEISFDYCTSSLFFVPVSIVFLYKTAYLALRWLSIRTRSHYRVLLKGRNFFLLYFKMYSPKRTERNDTSSLGALTPIVHVLKNAQSNASRDFDRFYDNLWSKLTPSNVTYTLTLGFYIIHLTLFVVSYEKKNPR